MIKMAGEYASAVDYLNNLRLGDAVAKAGEAAKGGLRIVDQAADTLGAQKTISQGLMALPKSQLRDQAFKLSRGALGKNIGRAIPVLGAVQAVADVGDIVFGNESAGNKIMDGTAMALGGTIGGVLGLGNPILAAAGASTGKAISDGLQYLFGDKKTPEQRKMEEALAMLKGGYV
jgi:hypothetical protein